jgi:hypothetical protein
VSFCFAGHFQYFEEAHIIVSGQQDFVVGQVPSLLIVAIDLLKKRRKKAFIKLEQVM